MATVTPPSRPARRDLARDQQKVRSPLTQLRGYIRSYVSLEGLALCLLYLVLWFWIGLVLDYGFFRAFNVDWVQDMPWGFRAGILVILSAGLLAAVALTVIKRLFREFSDPAVAIVLERRFPNELGDRLITAVELSDPQQAAGYGYSAAMVEETIHEAADRVSRVPVREVFNWKRLYRRAGLILLLSAGLYLLCVGTVCAVRAARHRAPVGAGMYQVNEVSTIWFERNVLLRNTIWPRRAHLELIEFPEDLRVAKDTAPPALRVRAWKYVLADGDAPEGWRPLTWEDVTQRGDLFCSDVPAAPPDWARTPRDMDRGLTADEVELRLDQFEVRRSVPNAELPEGWYVASDSEESGYRPLLWADLTPERLGGAPVPKLPADWDPKAWPMVGAGTIGAGSGHSAPLGALARRLVGPKYMSLTVQQVQEQLEKRQAALEKEKGGEELVKDIKNVLARLVQLDRLRTTLDQIDARTQETGMSRTLRRLTVPPALSLEYHEVSSRKDFTVPMTRIADNEYTGNFGELKETVSFVVRGEDYVTPRKTITVVDLPKLERLLSEEDRPAYLYYRADPDAVDKDDNVREDAVTAADLRGKKMPFAGKAVAVTGGDTSTVEAFFGSTVTLTGTVSKPLARVVLLRPVKGKPDAVEELEIEDGSSFRIKLGDVRAEQRFTIEFTDEDGVKGKRTVLVQPIEDSPPRVRDFGPDDVIHSRTKEGHLMVSASARIPFKGVAGDKQGLGRIRYAYTVARADFLAVQKSALAVPMIPVLPQLGNPRTYWGAVALAYKAARESAAQEAEGAGQTQYMDVEGFLRELRLRNLEDRRREVLEKKTVLGLLSGGRVTEPFRSLLRDYALRPDTWTDQDEDKDEPRRWVRADAVPPLNDLPVWKVRYFDRDEKKLLPLKEPDLAKPQRRFQLEVWLEVEDTDAEGEVGPDGKPQPHLTPSGEKFTFVVVPDNELLAKIGEEEDAKRNELLKIYKPLDESQQRLTKLSFELNTGTPGAGEVAGMAVRAGTMDAEVLSKAQGDTKAIYQAYDRILREMRTNQLREDLTAKVYKTVVKPLYEIDARHFDQTRAAMQALQKALDDPDKPLAERVEAGKERMARARKEMADLLRKMSDVLAAMQGISDINAIIVILREIERNEQDQGGLYKRLLEKAIREALGGDESKK
jgi:hypothetical protein